MHPIKKVNKIISNNKNLQWETEKLIYTVKAEINTVTDSIIIAGIDTPLNIVSITSQDKRESTYNESST